MRTLPPANSGNPFRDSARVLGVYVRASVLIFLSQVLLYSIGFAFTGVPWWFLLAFLCAVLGLIPHVGSLIGIAAVLGISALAGLNLTHLAIVGGIWIVVQAVEGFWLTPRLIGKPLGLRPLLVFLAMLAASLLFGPIGFVLAVPALAVGIVWFRYFKRWTRPALGAVPPPLAGRTSVPSIAGTGRDRDRSPGSYKA